jgi:EAL domain-containing protein (putative c-di-GMP-specific phosphodiesterase class I)
LAEDTGQIVQIGGWVLEQALDALAVMQRHTPDLTVSVNVSPVQIRRPEFIDEVAGLLERVGVDPSGLILEITENVFMAEPELAGERLGALRDLGIKISIDDFGTGYSSLTYLKRLPVHELKIDQSFVRGLPDDAADAALVKIILSAADELKLRVVAEGVELSSQADFFNKLPNVFLQGFLFDQPMPVDDWYERWLQ